MVNDLSFSGFVFDSGVLFEQLKSLFFSRFHHTEEDISREEELIALCKKDPAYFRAIYERYFERIYTYVYHKIGDYTEANDITSLVFMKALNVIKEYRPMGKPYSSFLYRVAFNEVNQFFRTKKKDYRFVSIEGEDLRLFCDETEIELNNNNISEEELLENLLNKLNREEVSLVNLRFFEGRSFADIGDQLEISSGNAKIRTYRAIDKLRKIYEQFKEKGVFEL